MKKKETATEASEIMIPLDKYPHIPYWFTLRQAMAELEQSEFDIDGRKSLPRVVLVFDETYQLLGMVRRRDILRGLEPSFLSDDLNYRKKIFDVKVDPNLSELSYDKLLWDIKKRSEKQVISVMQPIISTIDYNDHIMKVIYVMVDKNLRLIPVLKNNTVVGAIRSVDVFHEIAKFIL